MLKMLKCHTLHCFDKCIMIQKSHILINSYDLINLYNRDELIFDPFVTGKIPSIDGRK